MQLGAAPAQGVFGLAAGAEPGMAFLDFVCVNMPDQQFGIGYWRAPSAGCAPGPFLPLSLAGTNYIVNLMEGNRQPTSSLCVAHEICFSRPEWLCAYLLRIGTYRCRMTNAGEQMGGSSDSRGLHADDASHTCGSRLHFHRRPHNIVTPHTAYVCSTSKTAFELTTAHVPSSRAAPNVLRTP